MPLALALSCLLAASPAAPPDESKEYKAAYAKAQVDADADLKAGRAAFFAYGLRRSHETLDPETGLPIEAIAGCIVNDEILGRAAGNNDRIRDYVAKNGLPVGSFKKWARELGDLEAFVASRAKVEPAKRLTAGGPAIESPDGKLAIRGVPTKVKAASGQPVDMVGYILSSGKEDRPQAEFFWGAEADVTWGPEGSTFVVLRGRARGNEYYEAIDARSGRVLGSTMRAETAKLGA